MIYAIRDADGNVVNTIVADQSFVEGYCAENGFTFEEIEQDAPAPMPDPGPEQEPTVWDELDAAYQEGVNSAYDG